VLIGVTTYKLHQYKELLDLTKRCLASIGSQKTSFPFFIVVSDQRTDSKTLEKLKEFNVEVLHEELDCVSRSWNLLCEKGFKENQYCLILNNDIELNDGVLEPLPNFAKNNPRSIITSTEGFDFSAFLISKNIYDAVGPFDENLKGGALEDWDYVERMQEKNISILRCPTFNVQHKRTSTKNHVQANSEIIKLQEESKIYYRKKWGDGKHKLP